MAKPHVYSDAARRAAAEARTARANENARKLSPIVKAIQAQGITTLNGIAAALNGRRVPTPRGRGKWEATLVEAAGRVTIREPLRPCWDIFTRRCWRSDDQSG
jgi:hypothetical protein